MSNSTVDAIDIDTRLRLCGQVPVLIIYPGVWYSMVNISASVVGINIDIYVSTVTVAEFQITIHPCPCSHKNLCQSFPFDADLLSWFANKIQSMFAHTPDANQRTMP
jgi:hypothetical protein